MDDDRRITDAESVPDETTFLFAVRDRSTDESLEAILVRTPEGVACWLNYCQHLTHVSLDNGSGAEIRGNEIVCLNHGAHFEADTGLCTYGPCEGAYLNAVDVTVDDGGVYLSDERYEFLENGPLEREDGDRSSSSNVTF